MQASDLIFAQWKRGAVVVVNRGGDYLLAPAAFVYATEGGLAWLEPSYCDPWGVTSPALHRRAGDIAMRAGGVRWQGDDETVDIYPFDPEDDGDGVGQALGFWLGNMAARGVSFDDEREARRPRPEQ